MMRPSTGRQPSVGYEHHSAAMDARTYAEQRARLYKATVAMMAVFCIGVIGYFLLGQGEWTLLHCAYMTVVTLSTVGFGEVIPISGHPERELFTMTLLLVGMGTIFYFVSTFAAFIIEGDLADIVRRRRLEKTLSRITKHFIICGAGRSGSIAAQELVESGHEVVVIDRDDHALTVLQEHLGKRMYPLLGDATDDELLITAGIYHAKGVIAALSDDRDNLYVTFTARQLNSKTRIVSKALGNPRKIERAGADAVVAMNAIGGHRLFSELVRPRLTNFIDSLLLEQGTLRIDEFIVDATSSLVGQTLGDSNLRAHVNVLIPAARKPGKGEFIYNPSRDLVFVADMVLIAIGPADALDRMEELVRGSQEVRRPSFTGETNHPPEPGTRRPTTAE